MEIFRDIEGYEGLYQVSNYGNVKSLNYRHTGENRIMKPTTDKGGYLCINLHKNGSFKNYKVHRLVASAFIPNSDNLPQVNHKDECKTNNTIVLNSDGSLNQEETNLEWCTHKYNQNYGTRNKRMAETLKDILVNRPDISVHVDMLTKQGEFIRTFPSAHEAERWLRVNGFPKASQGNIIQCCRGNKRYSHAYGFKWRYATGN